MSTQVSLTEVTRSSKGQVAAGSVSLSDSLVRNLVEVYTDTGNQPSSHARNVAQSYVGGLKTKGYWLACGCKGNSLREAPILFPQDGRGGMKLVRNYSRPDHNLNCPFNRPRRTDTEAPSLATRARVAEFGIVKIRPLSDSANPTRKNGVRRQRSSDATVPSLARMLFTLFEHANLNRITPGASRNVSADKEALRNAFPQFFLDRARRLPVSRHTVTSFAQLEKLKRGLLASRSSTWPDKLVPQGFVIDQLEDVEFEEDTDVKWLVPTYGDKIPVHGSLLLPGAGTVGPYVVIALVALLPEESVPTIARAYVHPIHSLGELFPVDSGLERETFDILKRKQWQFRKAGSPFDIVKPLLDIDAPDGVRVRPDFILERSLWSCIIETMGYVDQDYRERKLRTHQSMAKLGPVVEHNPEDDKRFKDELAKQLTSLEREIKSAASKAD